MRVAAEQFLHRGERAGGAGNFAEKSARCDARQYGEQREKSARCGEVMVSGPWEGMAGAFILRAEGRAF